MLKIIINDIEKNVLDTKIGLVEHYLDTETNELRRIDAHAFLDALKVIKERMMISLERMQLKNKYLDDSEEVFEYINKKLAADYKKTQAYLDHMEHLEKVLGSNDAK